MARSVGIPARIAAGYSQGDWERDAQAYRVRQHHSHAWVEVFIPGHGWIGLDPTNNKVVNDQYVVVAIERDYEVEPRSAEDTNELRELVEMSMRGTPLELELKMCETEARGCWFFNDTATTEIYTGLAPCRSF